MADVPENNDDISNNDNENKKDSDDDKEKEATLHSVDEGDDDANSRVSLLFDEESKGEAKPTEEIVEEKIDSDPDDTHSTSSSSSVQIPQIKPIYPKKPLSRISSSHLLHSSSKHSSSSKSILSVKNVSNLRLIKPSIKIKDSKVKSKSQLSMSFHRDVEPRGPFELVWGKNKEWPYGNYLREKVKAVHKEHFPQAVKTIGEIPTGINFKPPAGIINIPTGYQSFVSSSRHSFSTQVSEVSQRSTFQKPEVTSRTSLCTPDIRKDILKEIKEDINEEEYLVKHLHPRFSGNYSVLIWSTSNRISPQYRLTSYFEIVTLSFCPHNINYLVGGTAAGHLVLWDLTNRMETKQESSYYVTNPSFMESQRIINDQLKWRRSNRSFKQIQLTALSAKKDCHLEKVIAIQWIHRDKVFDAKFAKIVPRGDDLKESLQFLSVSEDKTVKVWDLNSEPKIPISLRFPDKAFTRSNSAKRPNNLKLSYSKFSDLHRRWGPIYSAEAKRDEDEKSSFLFSVCAFSTEYYMSPVIEEYDKDDERWKSGAFFGTLCGEVGYFTFDGNTNESATAGFLDSIDIQMFNVYHDGPVNSISRHPLFDHICLTSGGHVFAIWSQKYLKEPIKWVRYRDVNITFCSWFDQRPSMFRIARSDGLVEFWDLLLHSHRPRTDKLSTGNVITMAVDLKFAPKFLIAVADITSTLRLYHINGNTKVLLDDEIERLRNMMDAEPERKSELEERGEKWRLEHIGRKDLVSTQQGNEEVLSSYQHPSTKDLQQGPCNPFMVQIYKWYLRRRGDKSVWLDEADRKWYAQEQAHMKNQILANKMWDQKKMDVVMKQLDKKEKREMIRKQRVQEILDQADEIYKSAVAYIFIKKEIELKASKISVKLEETKEFDVQSAVQETHLLFGEGCKDFEKSKLDDVNKFPMKEKKMLDVLAKYRQVRMVFNDARRFRDMKLKWLRNKLRREVEKYGCELIECQTKTNTLMKWGKYERRISDIDKLRDIFGVSYDPLWDKDKRVSKFEKRMKLGNVPIRYTISKKERKRQGLNLDLIVREGEITDLRPDQLEIQAPHVHLQLPEKIDPRQQVVEHEVIVPLELKERKSQLVQESVEQFTSHLPDIKKSVSFAEDAGGEQRTQSGGVLPLPDIIPRRDASLMSDSSLEPKITVDDDFVPYLEKLLSQPPDSESSSEFEDFEPDITVMEPHKDVEKIVDKLSSVYAVLKADVSLKPELHRFKWESTEEYLVSDDEEEKNLDEQELEHEGADGYKPKDDYDEEKNVEEFEAKEESSEEFID